MRQEFLWEFPEGKLRSVLKALGEKFLCSYQMGVYKLMSILLMPSASLYLWNLHIWENKSEFVAGKGSFIEISFDEFRWMDVMLFRTLCAWFKKGEISEQHSSEVLGNKELTLDTFLSLWTGWRWLLWSLIQVNVPHGSESSRKGMKAQLVEVGVGWVERRWAGEKRAGDCSYF